MAEGKSSRSSTNKGRAPQSIGVGQFFERHGRELHMKLLGDQCGFERPIRERTINRPGLALAGFYKYFAFRRIQVIGNAERSYLENLNVQQRRERFEDFCRRNIPCIIVSRGETLSDDLLEIAREQGISVFRTMLNTMNFINHATIQLEWDFAPIITMHGCMVDVMGIGIFLRGPSGSGKSECVLSLLRRGSSLVADDSVVIRKIEGRELVGASKEIGRSHMEVRGIGIINVGALFGVGSIRLEKRVDLVVSLNPDADPADVDRTGMDKKTFPLLGLRLPHVELPVAPGRDTAQLVEVAALDQKLRSFGYNSAVEFNKKLLKIMRDRRIS